jgi:hypothetical protein
MPVTVNLGDQRGRPLCESPPDKGGGTDERIGTDDRVRFVVADLTRNTRGETSLEESAAEPRRPCGPAEPEALRVATRTRLRTAEDAKVHQLLDRVPFLRL